ncbi:MFS transporter [Microbacterium sp. ASV49]|uniref:MFS transporter n=1 Tax=Microbacterium candidum TaxID=3041922 RepID=A0ABT7MUC2_9MICO|nr:MFS transporter [Microbacterium sp. ASV49]MDL9978045.1 MFS transporter [Microbacterium sp. ASV49]
MTTTQTTPSALAEPDVDVRPSWIGMLCLANIGLWMASISPAQLLLPAQLDHIAPADKVGALALISSLGYLITIVITPLTGLASDVTTSRWGRRRPWILAGTVIGAAFLVLLGAQTTVAGVLVCWVSAQAGFSLVAAAIAASIPDLVPRRQRGVVSAWAGFPQPLGALLGVALVALVFTTTFAGYAAVAILGAALTLPFVFFTREIRLLPGERDRPTVVDFLRSFWVNPIAHPDFGWAWICRFLMQLGTTVPIVYLYFIVQDTLHIEDPSTEVLVLIALSTLGATVCCLVAGYLSDRLRRRKPFVWSSCVLLAVGTVTLALVPTWAGMMIGVLIFGCGLGAYLAVDYALVTEVLPEAGERGKDLGVMYVANTLPQVLAPLLGGVIVGMLGGYSALLILSGLITVGGALAVLPIRAVR